MVKLDLSVIILTGNEEIHMKRCLDRVCDIAKDVFVIDCFSNDRTIEISTNGVGIAPAPAAIIDIRIISLLECLFPYSIISSLDLKLLNRVVLLLIKLSFSSKVFFFFYFLY